MDTSIPGERRLTSLIDRIQPVDSADVMRLLEAFSARPEGRLAGDDLCLHAARICAMHRHEPPRMNRRLVLLCAADHGTLRDPDEVAPEASLTAMRFLRGETPTNRMARGVGVPVRLLDVGVAADMPPHPGLIQRKVGRGTAPVEDGPAMTRDQAVESVLAGYDTFTEYHTARSVDVVGVGQVVSGPQRAARLVAAAVLGYDAGRLAEQAGEGDPQLAEAASRHLSGVEIGDPVGVLAAVGGFDIGAMAGIYLGAAMFRVGAVVGGLASSAAAGLAAALCPPVKDYLFLSHHSSDPLHTRLVERQQGGALLGFRIEGAEAVGATLGLGVLAAMSALWDED